MRSTAKKHFVQADGMIHIGDKIVTPKRQRDIIKYRTAYQAEHYRRFVIRYKIEDDADMINYLESLPNATDFIKEAIIRERARRDKLAESKAARAKVTKAAATAKRVSRPRAKAMPVQCGRARKAKQH